MLSRVNGGARAETLQELLDPGRDFGASGLRFVDRAERERFLGWGEIVARARATAGRLAAAGVAPGERVALVYPTAPGFFDAFFGTLLAGAVPVPLYPPVRLGRLEEYHERTARLIAAVGARLVLVDGRVAGLVGVAVERAGPGVAGRRLEELPPAPPLARQGAPGDLALVQFSSGTTVEPKPVALTQRAVLAQVAALNAQWPDTSEVTHSGVSWLPLYHDMGLIGCVFPALERPGTLTLVPPEAFVGRPALWLRAIARHRATISVAPNFAYALAAERVSDRDLEGLDLGAWRIALCGAETVAADTLRAFATRFAAHGFRAEALAPVYGLSEAALAVTFPPLGTGFRVLRIERDRLAELGEARDDPAGREIVSVGRPLAGFELELRDERGRRLGERRVGRLFTRGPSLFEGYLGRPEESARVLAGGWLDTGDLGFLAGGELFLTGRAKDVLILRGRNHDPADVELAVAALEGVRRGCVAACAERPEGADTDRLLLFVERPRGTSSVGSTELERGCREAVLHHTGLVVDEVVVLEAGTLPRTSSGKIRRGETLARHLAGRLDAPPEPGAIGLAREWLRGRRALGRARGAERAR